MQLVTIINQDASELSKAKSLLRIAQICVTIFSPTVICFTPVSFAVRCFASEVANTEEIEREREGVNRF